MRALLLAAACALSAEAALVPDAPPARVTARINALRSLAALPPIPPVELALMRGREPGAVEAAQLHAAEAFLARARPQAAAAAGGELARAEEMARRIVAERPRKARAGLRRLAGRLELGRRDPSFRPGPAETEALKAVLDDFFAAP